jgi:UDP-N-acetylglucosamine transferase subunit ALG13
MIFVTVGNSIKGVEFHRLIREMDDIARDLKEEVIAQIGFIEDPPRHIRSFSYLNYVETGVTLQPPSSWPLRRGRSLTAMVGSRCRNQPMANILMTTVGWLTN